MNAAERTHGRRRTLMLTIGLAVIAGAALLAGCSRAAPHREAPPAPVHVGTAVQKAMPVEVSAPGAGEAYQTVSVKSRVDAVVEAAHFKQGQDVRKGDVLFTLDPRSFQAALDQAEANLGRDTVQQKNAQTLAEHTKELLGKGYAAQEDYDQALTTADSLTSAVKADVAARDLARLLLSYCTITSPIDARTGAILVDPGNSIKANDAALVVLNQITPLYVSFAVPEAYLGAIRERMAAGTLAVQALIPGQEDRPEQGALSFVDNTVDPTTGTVALKATFGNEDRRLWPGQFINVVLTLSVQQDATVVPSQAVTVGQAGQFVFVLQPDGTVRSQPVVVDREIDGESVISSGVKAGDTVVTDGQLQLVNGTKVQVLTEGGSAGATSAAGGKEGPA
jgi:multidrug efflux system membrane fusion protein